MLVFSLPDEAPPVRKTPPVTSLPGAGDEEVRLSNDPVGDDAGTATSRTDSASNSPGDCAWRLLCGGTWCCGGTQLCGGSTPCCGGTWLLCGGTRLCGGMWED